MIIGSHYRLSHLNGDLNVTVNGQRLTRATNYRYLGIEVDEALGWQPHVDAVCKKVSAGIGAIKRIRSLVPRQTLLKMYDVAFVKIKFWSVVVGENFVFDEAYEEVGVARSHFGSHSNTVDLFVVVVTKRKTVECENQFG